MTPEPEELTDKDLDAATGAGPTSPQPPKKGDWVDPEPTPWVDPEPIPRGPTK